MASSDEIDEIKQKALDACKHLDAEKFDGVKYQRGFCTNLSVSAIFERMQNETKMRASDVIATGFPRSGNHWTYDVTHMILNQSTDFPEASFIENYWELRDFDVLDDLPSPRQLCTHARPRRYPPEAFKLGCKMVFIIRNPKDAIRSFYEFAIKMGEPKWQFRGTWDQFFELHLMGEYPYGNWCDNALALEKAMADHPNHPIYIHQYEEMIRDPIGSVQKLCRFLEKPEKMAQDIVDATNVAKMKAHDNSSREKELLFGKNDHNVIGKGGVGGWKDYFTVAQSERFNQHFEEKMAGTKIGELIRPYL